MTITLAKIAGFAFAAFVTVGLLASVDHLAYEQHAVVQMAKQGASAPATTAARSAERNRI
jgi:hypothetical protein